MIANQLHVILFLGELSQYPLNLLQNAFGICGAAGQLTT